MINIYYSETASEAGKKAANIIANLLKSKSDAVLGLATGSSPIGMYGELISKYEQGEISFSNVKTVNLDEYVGLSADHDQSYSYFMHHNLFNHVDIKEDNTNIPNGLAGNPSAECARYDSVIASMGGVDIQVLGIGNNGHIGFNEPSDSFSVGTVLVDLTDSTIDANARFFESRNDVPTQAISMGVGQIMQAKGIILLAMGKGKAEILEKSLFGPVTPAVPASVLQLFRGNVYVCADADALSVISERHPAAIIK